MTKEQKSEQTEEPENKPETFKVNENKQAITTKSEKPSKPMVRQKISPDLATEISDYLKGSELKKEQLQKYGKQVGSDIQLKSSIELCVKFWSLNGETDNSYDWMKTQIDRNKDQKYNTLIDSELKSF